MSRHDKTSRFTPVHSTDAINQATPGAIDEAPPAQAETSRRTRALLLDLVQKARDSRDSSQWLLQYKPEQPRADTEDEFRRVSAQIDPLFVSWIAQRIGDELPSHHLLNGLSDQERHHAIKEALNKIGADIKVEQRRIPDQIEQDLKGQIEQDLNKYARQLHVNLANIVTNTVESLLELGRNHPDFVIFIIDSERVAERAKHAERASQRAVKRMGSSLKSAHEMANRIPAIRLQQRLERVNRKQEQEKADKLEPLGIRWEKANTTHPLKSLPPGTPYTPINDYVKSGATRYERTYLYRARRVRPKKFPTHMHEGAPVLTPSDVEVWQATEQTSYEEAAHHKRAGTPPGYSVTRTVDSTGAAPVRPPLPTQPAAVLVPAQRLAAQLTGLVLVPDAALPAHNAAAHDVSAPEALAASPAAAPPGADAEPRPIERATADGLLRWWGLEDPEAGTLRLRLRSAEPALAGVRLRLRAGPTFSREVVLQARAGRPEVRADVLLSRAERAALQPGAALRVEVVPAEEPEGPQEAAPGRPETAS